MKWFFFRFFHRKRTFSWPFHFLFPFTGVPPTITELMWLIVTKFSPASLQSLLSNHKLWECLYSLCFFDVCPVLLPCWLPLCYNISATVVRATSLPRRLDDQWTFQMCADTSCNSFSFPFASKVVATTVQQILFYLFARHRFCLLGVDFLSRILWRRETRLVCWPSGAFTSSCRSWPPSPAVPTLLWCLIVISILGWHVDHKLQHPLPRHLVLAVHWYPTEQ